MASTLKITTMNFKQLHKRTINWAIKVGILQQGTSIGQARKTLEEAQELFDAVLNNDRDKIGDGIGDLLVSVTNLAEMQGMDILAEWAKVLDIIEKRKGKMINGQFVKE